MAPGRAPDAWDAAGPPEILVTTWGTAEGLPQNTVNGMATTPDGFLWIATFGGVARFDGLGFDVFDLGRDPGLGANRWVNVAAADGGVVLMAESGDLVWFDGGDRVRRIPAPGSGIVRGGLVPDGSGGLWLASPRLLSHWDGSRWRSWGADEGLTSVAALMVDRRGRPWISHWGGVSRLEDGVLRPVVEREQVGGLIRGQHEDAEGRVWLAGEAGLWLLGADDVPRRVEVGATCEPPFVNVASRGAAMWIVTRSGACRFRFGPDETLRPAVTYVEAAPLNERGWEALLVDAEGSAWVGSSGSGLRRFSSARVRRWTTEKGLARGRGVSHLAGDGAGGIWVGMGCSGLQHVGGDGVRTLDGERTGGVGSCVRSLLRERDRGLWVGMNLGLSRLGPDGSVTTWPPPPTADSSVRALARDSTGRIWAGLRGRVAVIGPDDSVTWLGPEQGLRGTGSVRSLLAGPDGAVWAGTDGAVFRIELGPDGSADVVELDGDDGVPPGEVRAMRIDDRGRLWVGTYGGGLAVMGGEGPGGRITTREGLFDNAISAIVEDESSRLWFLGNRGVSVVAPAMVDSVLAGFRPQIDAVSFGEDEGVPEGNGGSPAAFLDRRGRAWFATIDGFAGLDTRAFPEDRVPTVARVAGIESENRVVRAGDPWTVRGAEGSVSFLFSAPSLPAAGATRFRYRLVGYDDGWIDGGSERVARYTGLKGGRYRFEVLARNRDGVWGTEPASIAVRVIPFWWQRIWTRALLAAAVLGIGGALFARRIRTVEERNVRLERAIRERDEAEEKARRHQRELAHVARLATAGELATTLAHELNQPLMAIVSNAAASDQLLSNPDMGKDVVRDALRDIVSESRRASDVIRNLRRFLQRGATERVPLRVERVIDDVLGFLRGELRDSGVEVTTRVAPELPEVHGDPIQLQQVLVNLIMNAVEAMRTVDPARRRLEIEAVPAPGGLEVAVRDTGPGFDPDSASSLFEPFYTTKETGMGVGLAIVRTLVEAYGGKVRAAPRPEGGAEFRLFLPVAEGQAGVDGTGGPA